MRLVAEDHKSQCIPTDQAKEITNEHQMAVELSDWHATRNGKASSNKGRNKKNSNNEIPLTFECEGVVTDKWMDVTIPGLSVKLLVTRPETLAFTRTTSTLFFIDSDGIAKRVVQVETRDPLPKSQSDQHWPHLHFGYQYWKLEEKIDNLSYHGNLSLFTDKSNVEIKNAPENPFEPGVLELKS